MHATKYFAIIHITACLLIFYGCANSSSSPRTPVEIPDPPHHFTIGIAPISKNLNWYLDTLCEQLSVAYDVDVDILPPSTIPSQFWKKKNQQMMGDTILRHLQTYKPNHVDIMVVVTTAKMYRFVDMETKKKSKIKGIAANPGIISLISVWDFDRKKIARDQRGELSFRIMLHELGHNFGLKHCTFSNRCLMDEKVGYPENLQKLHYGFCDSCHQKLKAYIAPRNTPYPLLEAVRYAK